jgi:hypothetical protein
MVRVAAPGGTGGPPVALGGSPKALLRPSAAMHGDTYSLREGLAARGGPRRAASTDGPAARSTHSDGMSSKATCMVFLTVITDLIAFP